MADGETAGGDEEGCEVLNDAPSTQPGPNVVSQVTTVTKNINIGQEVNVNGSQNIIIMTGNTLHVIQQNSQCESVGHTVTQPSQSPPPPRHNTTSCNNNSSCDIDVPGLQLQMSRVRYADGPPDKVEILKLTKKLAGALGPNWKLLAVPLSIPDYELMSIEHEEATLLLKINTLLVKWVDCDVCNDRMKLAALLSSVEGFNLAKHCRASLLTT